MKCVFFSILILMRIYVSTTLYWWHACVLRVLGGSRTSSRTLALSLLSLARLRVVGGVWSSGRVWSHLPCRI